MYHYCSHPHLIPPTAILPHAIDVHLKIVTKKRPEFLRAAPARAEDHKAANKAAMKEQHV
jgi:hypothetical protein